MTLFEPQDEPPHPRPRGFGARIRTWFLTGVVIAGPLAVTLYIVWWFVDTVDGMVKKIIPVSFWPETYLPARIPGLGVIFAFLALTLLGFLAANLLGRSLIKLGESLLDRMPVVRGIYKSVKQIFETLFSQSGTTFRKVGLVRFPMSNMWSLVFISTPPSGVLAEQMEGEDHISVFLPCTPNPTTGFFLYLPAKDVVEIDMSPDDAAKLIMSAGLIQPETQKVLKGLAEKTMPDNGKTKSVEAVGQG